MTETELLHADLGDARLNARLRTLVDAFTARPAASIPEACADAVDQTDRFFANPGVRADAIRAAHYADTTARCVAAPGPIVLASDTTWLDFRIHPRTRGLGYQQHRDQHGLVLHSTLACTADGVPLGLLDQRAWARDPADFGQRRRRNQRATADKESRRWLRAWAACHAEEGVRGGAIAVGDAGSSGAGGGGAKRGGGAGVAADVSGAGDAAGQ